MKMVLEQKKNDDDSATKSLCFILFRTEDTNLSFTVTGIHSDMFWKESGAEINSVGLHTERISE
jgi:hypothetical protein